MGDKTRYGNLETKIDNFMKNSQSNFDDLKENVTSLKDELLNLKDIIIKNLQEENEKLKHKISKLEENQVKNEVAINNLEQYGRRNNLEINGIPTDVNDEILEEKVIDVLAAAHVHVDKNEIEDCHRIGKANPKTTIIRFVNRRLTKQALYNRKYLKTVDKNELGLKDHENLYFNENLTPFNAQLAYNC